MTTTKQIRRIKPEERELDRKRREQERFESDLAECELRLANLRGELSALEHRYLKLVGLPYAELDELRAQLAECMAAEDPGNERLQRAAREARLRADASRTAASVKESEETRNFSPTPELKRAYREVAKRIHPDLTTNEKDRARRQELMAEANEAYQQGDESRLAKILDTYESSPETVEGEGAGAELVRVIRKLSLMKNRLGEIEMESQRFFSSDLYLLKIQAEDAHEQGRDLLVEMADKVRKRIADCKERLEAFAPGRVH
ncbi:MAG: J domain-containing protein [Candidatus Acidiferrales bacterium]